MPFENNIFINCPFDDSYDPLLKAMIFCVLYIEHNPLIAMTTSSNDIRINQIKTLIRKSRFGIHDISRKIAAHKGDYGRFNMPFEPGLDIGCQTFGQNRLRRKKSIILDSTAHAYDISLSDISGQYIETHANDPKQLIIKIRNRISRNYQRKSLPPGEEIWADYIQFTTFTKTVLNSKNIRHLNTSDYIKYVKDWLRGAHKEIPRQTKKPSKRT